jgi:hypothetical protein
VKRLGQVNMPTIAKGYLGIAASRGIDASEKL